jgi:hypothetical protein
LVIGKVQVRDNWQDALRSATRCALIRTERRLLKLLTPRKKTYIHCIQFKSYEQVQLQRKEKHKMGGDAIKGGQPKKKAKKKPAKKKAAKKK